MIAKLIVLLPYSIALPENEKFKLYPYHEDGCKVQINPPIRCSDIKFFDDPDEIKIDQKPAYLANGLLINFFKDQFDRQEDSAIDPSMDLMKKVIDSFLIRARFVTRSGRIRDINFPHMTWKLEYLNDDGSELRKEEGKIRGRSSGSTQFSYRSINPDVWNDIFQLPFDYKAPKWDTLILDAHEILPEVGPAIVLTATALEVFIAQILSDLQQLSLIPRELWDWINKRQSVWQEPSFTDQFDILLKTTAGFSLKENEKLWKSFKDIKEVRNNFVHTGVPLLAKKVITIEETRSLIGQAIKIIKFIRSKLPSSLQWPEYRHKMKVQVSKKIIN